MNPKGRAACQIAVKAITMGQYAVAQEYLRLALKYTTDRRAWSKIMLAIRELSRVLPTDCGGQSQAAGQ
jgi:hypothetical protein